MSDLDLLNDLGLTSDATDGAPVEGDVVEGVEAEAATRAKRTEIKIVGTIAKQSGLLPARAPSGGGFGERGSKYPFETLAAPTVDAEGNPTAFDFFEVKLTDVENADAKKLQGAIQAAVAAQNKTNKTEGNGIKYVSRTVLGEDGSYVGAAVYRTDKYAE
ncbi:hypothetical protein CPT_Palo_014 [Rhizobium phage Palo]|uniref:Uncharacterized protein n=1 Tax=Rhizobium phage Palo TaxID=2767573 RepID=A0A7L8G4I3_9CAUD|nr:hypothetical protein CPT_Palo_014 [Rhizobium phage Palo]